MKNLKSFKSIIVILWFCLFLFSCGKTSKISAGGATLPFPVYEKWFGEYAKKYKVNVDYQAIGSGSGQRKLKDELLEFIGSDVLLSAEIKHKMEKKGHKVLGFPTLIGAIAITYNLKLKEPLKLSPSTLAGIFLGKITKWTDKEILEDNPKLKKELKKVGKITVVYRADSSGTTEEFTDYLSSVSMGWKDQVGTGKSVNWLPSRSVGSKGNAGVVKTVKSKKGSIGYASLNYVKQLELPYATLKNASGNWVMPTGESVKSTVEDMNFYDEREVKLYQSLNKKAYPLSVLTYVFFVSDLNYMKNSKKQATDMVHLFYWMLSDEAQKIAEDKNYFSLPVPLREEIKEKVLSKATFKGEKLLK